MRISRIIYCVTWGTLSHQENLFLSTPIVYHWIFGLSFENSNFLNFLGGGGLNQAMQGFIATRRNEVYLCTDFKSNAKSLENIFSKTTPSGTPNPPHSAPQPYLSNSQIPPQNPDPPSHNVKIPHNSPLPIQKFPFSTPHFSHFFIPPHFSTTPPKANPHHFPTFPQPFPQSQIPIVKP